MKAPSATIPSIPSLYPAPIATRKNAVAVSIAIMCAVAVRQSGVPRAI